LRPPAAAAATNPPTLFQKICNQQPTPKQPFFVAGYIYIAKKLY
jgi:hypothetical protein